jgi:ABC-type sulfate/molybdate transport systems ATPase subunit
MTLLEVSKISKRAETDFTLEPISFSQRKLQKIAIAGETGSGKSTLMKIIAGLVQPDEGQVIFEGKAIEGPQDKLIPGHPGISYLSQHFELPKFLRVEQVLAYSNMLTGQQANTIYEVCEITHLLKRKTDQLSGGERQRIALAKLLIASPRLLLLDEPFTNLDMIHKNTLKAVIRNIGKELKITCMLISHDAVDILSWADQIVVMRNGQMVQKAAPEKIYRQPADEYVAGLFGKYTLIDLTQSPEFSRSLKVNTKGKRLFIRPENFNIAKRSKTSMPGKVNKISFCGSYYELEVSIATNVIIVTTPACSLKSGDPVYISLADYFLL